MSFGDERSPRPAVGAPRPGPVLVIAARAGDAALGCGGAIALHRAQGDAVHVLAMYGEDAGGVVAAVGEAVPEAWGLACAAEPTQDELFLHARRLARRLVDLRVTTLYAPWHGEQRVERWAASHAAALAVELADFDGAAWGYEVETPLVPEVVFDVSAHWEAKREAAARHAAGARMLRACEGLAAHRSLHLVPRATHGEAFCHLTDLRIRVPRSAARGAPIAS